MPISPECCLMPPPSIPSPPPQGQRSDLRASSLTSHPFTQLHRLRDGPPPPASRILVVFLRWTRVAVCVNSFLFALLRDTLWYDYFVIYFFILLVDAWAQGFMIMNKIAVNILK